MRKVIAALNMTLDGYCDHTYGIADDDLHNYYTALLKNAGTLLYGRTTYQLMEFWPTLLKNPSGHKSMDDFAIAIDSVPKVVFSHTLNNLEWASARLATRRFEEEVLALRQQPGKDIFVSSPSLIVQSINLSLVDELQLCIHPVIAGKGLLLFKNISDKHTLKLLNSKIFESGVLMVNYQIQGIDVVM
jgi:dihydrofolate reductase